MRNSSHLVFSWCLVCQARDPSCPCPFYYPPPPLSISLFRSNSCPFACQPYPGLALALIIALPLPCPCPCLCLFPFFPIQGEMKRRRNRPKGDKDRDEDRPKGDPLPTRQVRNRGKDRTDARYTRETGRPPESAQIVLHASGIALWDRLNSVIDLAKSYALSPLSIISSTYMPFALSFLCICV